MTSRSSNRDPTPEPIRILHVDDEPDFAEMAATFLEREDDQFNIDTATSASEGLDYLLEGDYDCIVSDYEMPGQNGIQFLEAVRGEDPDLPFVLYTGKGSEEIASDAISAGVTDYLQKESGSSQYTVLANRVTNAVEQYRAQRELKTSQQRLSLFFEESPLGAIQWNENFEFTRVNDTAEDILGYTEAELLDNSWEMIVPRSDREVVADIVSELLGDEGGYHSVNENITKDGEAIVCEWHNRVVTDESGEIRAIFSKFQDITEEYRRRERRKRQREALLELSTDDAVTSGDFETAVKRITETAAYVLDVPRVNVWLLDDDEGDDVLTCIDHYDRPADSHDDGMELVPEECPSYFEALKTHRAIDADDAREDSRTAELIEYLDTHNIGALLDATLRAEGEVVGVVCHEHVDGTRDWTDDELEFASDVADITHRALRNQERREQRRELKRKDRAMDAAPVGITISDPAQDDNPLIYVNERFTELTGYTADETLGSNCRFLQGEGTDSDTVAQMRAAIDSAEPVTVELRNYRKDGTEFWNRVSIAPVRTDEGEVANYVGFQQDVTAEKEREHDLEETNTVLSTLFETLPVGILVEDAARNIRAVNERLFELFELPHSPDEVIGTDCEQVAREVSEMFAEPDGFVDRINEVVAERTPTDNEELALADGRTFERAYRPIELPEGDSHLWIYGDITVQKERLEIIRDLQHRAQDLVRADTTEAVAQTAVDIARETLGFPLSGVHLVSDDRDVLEPIAVTDEVREYHGEAPRYDRTDPSRSADVFNWEVFKKGSPLMIDDTRVFEEIDVSDTPSRSGIIYPLGDHGLFITSSTEPDVFDDTDRYLVELLATILTAALDRSERETELREQQRRLQAERERLNEFASIVSHDLRNPLNVAEGRLVLAREECDSEHLAAVARAHERMETLIDDLLTLAREGEHVSDTAAVDLAALSEKCWQNVETGDATIHTQIDRRIQADQSRLAQLLENLIRNAVEHGGENVTITVGELDDGFYVEDDGSGIPEDEREDVFDAGYSTSEEGTGFGLSIVKQVAEAHGWEIRVTDGTDGGARFEITGVEFVDE